MPVNISIVEASGALYDKLALSPVGRDNKYCFSAVATGEKALGRIPSGPPDIALVNFHLPVMDGFECVRKLKARLPRLPVLMFTTDWETGSRKGRLEIELIFSAAHAGADGYLPKDLSAFEITNAIEQLCEGARRDCRTFLMFFDSDRSLGMAARHWGKIATMINAPFASISYGRKWRTVALTGRMDKVEPSVPSPLGDFHHESRQLTGAPFRSHRF